MPKTMHKWPIRLQVLLGPLAKHPEVPPACAGASGQHPRRWAELAASTPRPGHRTQPQLTARQVAGRGEKKHFLAQGTHRELEKNYRFRA